MNHLRRLLSVVILGLAACGAEVATAATPGQAVATTSLQNVFKLEGEFYSGTAPEGEEGFRELQKLGVKTIVSVDGSQPNVQAAHKFGMRYVHLPFGYDGVPQARGVEIARAVQTAAADGPVYLHCHHGQHRGPAAAAIVCRALDGWSPERADEFLKQAGTSHDYAGLYRDVERFQPPTSDELARLPSRFPETTKTGPLVDAMVAIDEQFDLLKAAQKAGWREVLGHPELQPAQTAVLVWEAFREMGRDPETKKRGEDYAAKAADGERAADVLLKVLKDPSGDAATRDAALQSVTKTCSACHKAHRN